MKKNKWFGWAFVATMMGASFSACSNEAEEMLAQESEIKLTSEITPSRVTSLDYQSTQIIEGQQVGITITGAKSEHNNVAWEVGADGALTTENPVYYSGSNTATITAYHPYNEDWDANQAYDFLVNVEQSNEANYRNSDLLWTAQTANRADETVALTFVHKLAKINVTLTSDNIADLTDATISICGTKIKTTVNPITGKLSEATGEAKTIIAGITTADAKTASAIVIPQTVESGTQFIKVEHGGKTYYYTLEADKVLKPSYSHNYELKVNDQTVELIAKSNNINPWIPEETVNDNVNDEENNGNAVATIPNNEIWYTSTYGTVITPYSKNLFGATIESNEYTDGKGIIKFDGDVTSIGNQAFYSCDGLTSITIPNSVATIGEQAFYNCTALTSIIIPNSVTTIGNYAFQSCTALTSVTIPNNVANIGNGVFGFCPSLASITVEENNNTYDSRNNCNGIVETATNTLISGCKSTIISDNDNVTTIGFHAFMGCSYLTTFAIPSTVTKIESYAFFACFGLTTITIPNSVTTITGSPFIACSSLASISVEEGNSNYDSRNNCNAIIETATNTLISGCKTTAIPNDVTTIGDSAFHDCLGLTTINIPNSVTKIEFQAFGGCQDLSTVNVEATNPPTLGSEIFFNTTSSLKIYVPANSVTTYMETAGWSSYSSKIYAKQ